MAEPPRPKSHLDWEHHKADIIDLYHRRKLPLQNKTGGPSVIQIMRDEYNFSASLSQYEAQIRRWGKGKNLKGYEWKQIITKMDDLRLRGVETRLKVNGSLVSADKIQKKRRRHIHTVAESLSGPFVWNTSRFVLEMLSTDGQWYPYRDEEASSNDHGNGALASNFINREPGAMIFMSMNSRSPTVRYSDQLSVDEGSIQRSFQTTPSNDPLQFPWPEYHAANAEIACNIDHMETILDLNQDNLATELGRNGSPSSPDYLFNETMDALGTDRGFTSSTPSQEFLLPIAGVAETPSLLPGESLNWSLIEGNLNAFSSKRHEESPFFLLEKHIQSLCIESPSRSEQNYMMFETCQSDFSISNELAGRHRGQSNTSVFRSIASIARNAQMIAAFPGQEQSIPNQQSYEFADCLDSILPDNRHGLSNYHSASSKPSSAANRLLESPVQRAILYSTINSFAGLPRLPALSLLQYCFKLFGVAKSYPYPTVISMAMMSFVDNAFSVAVWSCNAQAIELLLRVTHGTSYAIDVKKIIAIKGEASSTPIEVALRYSRQRLVDQSRYPRQCLETAEVLLKAGAEPTPALQYLMEDRRCPDPTKVKFIRGLLDRGAKPDAQTIRMSMQHGDLVLTKLLVDHIPRSSYQIFFEDSDSLESSSSSILAHIALYMKNDTATQIIKSVLCECTTWEIERSFPGTYQRTLDHTLIHACIKANHELVKFMLSYLARVSSAALVAAIRSRQQVLIELILESGAHASDMPAYSATGLPKHCNCHKEDPEADLLKEKFYTPLAEAIRSRNGPLVQMLAYTLSEADSRCVEQALEAAVHVGDLGYLQAILHTTSSLIGKYGRSALCLAVDQNHDDMAFMLLDAGAEVSGPPCSPSKLPKEYPLLSAIGGRKKKLIEAMLEHDVNLSDPCYIRAAALLGDINIVTALLSSQATVSLRALRTALKGNNEIVLNILLDHFWRHDVPFQSWSGGFEESANEPYGDDDLMELVRSAACAKNDTLLVSFLEHGARVGRRTVRAAIRRNDPVIKERLLAAARGPGLPLDAIVELKDHAMLHHLLSSGRIPMTEEPFLHAMRFDKKSYGILMEAFRVRYPQGLKGWGGSLLKNAIRKDDSYALRELLTARMDVNSFSEFELMSNAHSNYHDTVRSTPLGYAIGRKKGKNLDNVRMLINAGSEPNGIAWASESDELGLRTPLLLAIETGDLDLIEVLLEGGADVNLAARNGKKRTPLQRACELSKLPVVELLMRWKVDVNGEAAVRAGGTALQFAAIGGSIEIAKLLIQNGAEVRATPAKIHGRTPFEGAAEHGRIDMLKVIWDATFPEGIPEEEASNAIHFSRMHGHRNCEDYIGHLIHLTEISELSGNRRGGPWTYAPRLHDEWQDPTKIYFDGQLGDESGEDTEESAYSDFETSGGEEESDWEY